MLNVAQRGKQKERESIGEQQDGEPDQHSKRKPRRGGVLSKGKRAFSFIYQHIPLFFVVWLPF